MLYIIYLYKCKVIIIIVGIIYIINPTIIAEKTCIQLLYNPVQISPIL